MNTKLTIFWKSIILRLSAIKTFYWSLLLVLTKEATDG